MRPFALATLLLFSHSAAATGTDKGIDGGTSGVSDVAVHGGPDTPLAEAGVFQVDGGWFLTDERMLLVGQRLAVPCPLAPGQPEPEPVLVLKPFLYGVAAGAMTVALAVIAVVVYERAKP